MRRSYHVVAGKRNVTSHDTYSEAVAEATRLALTSKASHDVTHMGTIVWESDVALSGVTHG